MIDDSAHQGTSIANATRVFLSNALYDGFEFLPMVMYASEEVIEKYYGLITWFRIVSMPRIFAWNWLHHGITEKSAFDFDGIFCPDPVIPEYADPDGYRSWLENVEPLWIPSRKIKAIVTSRLEKHRDATRLWIEKHGVQYDELVMLDGMTAEQRMQGGAGPIFKARWYKQSDAELFIESDKVQAASIADLSEKPVFCPPHSEYDGEVLNGSS